MLSALKPLSISEIKARTRSMLLERDGFHAPSNLWAQAVNFFSYVYELPEEHYANLRLHTYHFTGDNYQSYVYPANLSTRFLFRRNWLNLIRGIPEEYVLSEPDGAVRGIGFNFGSLRISSDIIRFQRIVNTLYRSGILTREGSRRFVLEIGGGYGGLAHHISRLMGDCTYVIVDLPETLFFSAVYLSLLNPSKRMYLYSPSYSVRDLRDLDFVLLPNYRLQTLDGCFFNLALNVSSMGEMSTAQVAEYLTFIKGSSEVFYSWNQDRHEENGQLANLTEMLKKQFNLFEIPPPELPAWRDIVKQRIRRIGKTLIDGPYRQHPSTSEAHEYLCYPT